jgi:tetratricopeptide (TPR) repeat protein
MQEAEKALEESSGIASIVTIDGALQVSFSKNFLDFCKGKDAPSAEKLAAARLAYTRFLTLAQTYSGDRVAAAFRTAAARAAHQACSNGDMEQARDLYEQAILADSTNGLLRDRYAYFLFRDIRDREAALHQSQRATQLLPQEGEVWLTRGVIEARSGDVRAAELSLAKAESLGVSSIRCGIQRAWAYLKCKPRQVALAERQLLALESATSSQQRTSRDRVEISHIRERLNFIKEHSRT